MQSAQPLSGMQKAMFAGEPIGSVVVQPVPDGGATDRAMHGLVVVMFDVAVGLQIFRVSHTGIQSLLDGLLQVQVAPGSIKKGNQLPNPPLVGRIVREALG